MYLCLTRRWKTDGLKGKYNSPVPEEEYNRNKLICDTLRGIECASNPKCLWAKENEQFELEGPTIKLIKNIKTQIMTKDELDKNLKTRSEFVSSEAIQKIQKMITIDEENIAYEIESTDFDDNLSFNGRFREFIRSLTKKKNKPKHNHHQKQTPHHKKEPHPNKTPNRRRLEQLNADGRAEQNYRSVGLIATIYPPDHRVQPNGIYSAATGSIIHVTNNDPSHPKYIYVLVAAHDMIRYEGPGRQYPGIPRAAATVRMYGPLADYKFVPQFAGNADELRGFNVATQNVGALERVWIPQLFDYPDNSLDVAILKFRVPQAFNVEPLRLQHDDNVPTVINQNAVPVNYQTNAYNKDFIYYEMTYNNGNFDTFQMHHKDVNIYCYSLLCMYRNTQIKQGYCGGPIIHDNRIMAMQASRKQLPGSDQGNDCDEINPNNCIGYAMNMQQNLIETITYIYTTDARVGELDPHGIDLAIQWETQAGYIEDRNNIYRDQEIMRAHARYGSSDSDSDEKAVDQGAAAVSEHDGSATVSQHDARQEMNNNMYTYPIPYGYYNSINPNHQYLSNDNNNGNYVTIEWLAIFLPTLLINLCLFVIICLALIGFGGIFCYQQVQRAHRDHHANSSYHPLQRKDGSDEDV